MSEKAQSDMERERRRQETVVQVLENSGDALRDELKGMFVTEERGGQTVNVINPDRKASDMELRTMIGLGKREGVVRLGVLEQRIGPTPEEIEERQVLRAQVHAGFVREMENINKNGFPVRGDVKERIKASVPESWEEWTPPRSESVNESESDNTGSDDGEEGHRPMTDEEIAQARMNIAVPNQSLDPVSGDSGGGGGGGETEGGGRGGGNRRNNGEGGRGDGVPPPPDGGNGERKEDDDEEPMEEPYWGTPFDCDSCGGHNDGGLRCGSCSEIRKDVRDNPEIMRDIQNFEGEYYAAMDALAEDGDVGLLIDWMAEYRDRGYMNRSVRRNVMREIRRSGRYEEYVGRRDEVRARSAVGRDSGSVESDSGVVELPASREELFVEVRRLVRQRLSNSMDFVDPSELMSGIGVIDLGFARYRVPEVMGAYREVLEAEIGMRVRLHNGMVARKGGDYSTWVENWQELMKKPEWDQVGLRVPDYVVLGRMQEAGGFSVALMDRALQWLYTEVERGGYAPGGELTDASRNEVRRRMIQAFGGGSPGVRDALDLAWDFWQSHEAEAGLWPGHPLYNAVNFRQKFLEKGILPVGEFLKSERESGPGRFWGALDRFLSGAEGEKYERGGGDIPRLMKDGFELMTVSGQNGWNLIREGRLISRLALSEMDRSPYENMVTAAVASKGVWEMVIKIPEVKQQELTTEGMWVGWKIKIEALKAQGVLTPEEADLVKLLYAKSLLWYYSPYNQKANQFNDPGNVRMAFHRALDSGFFALSKKPVPEEYASNEQYEEDMEAYERSVRVMSDFRRYAELVWGKTVLVFGSSRNEGDRKKAKLERQRKFDSRAVPSAGR
ncbi:hypothetical protein [Candidatus Chazhemtobacterium aquaticus]|uniref:Uncharacterized protein n=1 Tax=Candidatus Chazhemtobacterium aquaticus TaxID=2715735 RepID=A0A857NB87_9BACT|nr:hypothetical protein [Candidatus Chazhemtobacterium aquaticus]QHO63192.1 hypothetical protein MICH65_0211 [Candidatus Chazhemtobacterium aquaticus]